MFHAQSTVMIISGRWVKGRCNLVFHAQSTITVISGRWVKGRCNLVFHAQSTITVISGRWPKGRKGRETGRQEGRVNVRNGTEINGKDGEG